MASYELFRAMPREYFEAVGKGIRQYVEAQSEQLKSADVKNACVCLLFILFYDVRMNFVSSEYSDIEGQFAYYFAANG